MAIVGPSGCGKTTLLKTIAGLNSESGGNLKWEGRDLAEERDFEPWEIGYVPQFSIAYDELTVDESIECVTRLRVKTRGENELDERIDRVLGETGLEAIADRRVSVLSGGQKRRLGLAMELVSDPNLLLCDEVTSGLDPRSEREIVHLLHDLSRKDGRVVISVTHSLAHLELYDSILVLHEGRVAYHGPPPLMNHYFGVDDTEEVYPKLAKQESLKWASSWAKHRPAYYDKLDKRRAEKIKEGSLKVPVSARNVLLAAPSSAESSDSEKLKSNEEAQSSKIDDDVITPTSKLVGDDSKEIIIEEPEPTRMPGIFSQFTTLLSRRWRIFARDRGQMALQIAMIIIFPLVISLFGDHANGAVKRFTAEASADLESQIVEREAVTANQIKKGSGVSGIIMLEVILLGLMASNNSAREIAGERKIMEKEKFGGMRPMAYLASKVGFLACLVLIQSLVMAMVVEMFWKFEGGFPVHLTFLILINASMTAICLGISSMMRTPAQSSLLCLYLVGFQLPLSGAILALPQSIDLLVRPFISAYWAWSGSISALNEGVGTAVRNTVDTSLSDVRLCLFVLLAHLVVGGLVALVGINRAQWES